MKIIFPLGQIQQDASNKKTYLEWLRIISAFLVIYNHTRLRGFNLYTVTTEASSFWFSIIMNSICKIAVPVFLMISGVTLLSKQESYKKLFQKRILKYILIIILFGTLQYLRYFWAGKITFSVRSWFSCIFCKPLLETYWFLYLYLGFLLLLPFLRKTVKCMQAKDYIYLYILNIIFCILNFTSYFTGFNINGNIFQLTNVTIYPLLGYGIDKLGHRLSSKFYMLSFVIPICLSTLGCALYMSLFPDLQGIIENIFQQFTPLIACGLFGLVKIACKDSITCITESKKIYVIGDTMFGVYLIEDIVRNQVEKLFLIFNFDNIPHDFTVGILFTTISFAISISIIYVIRFIPLIKRII